VRVLVTGATGQAGYYLARRLLDAGHEVIGTTRTLGGPAATALRAALPALRLVRVDVAVDRVRNAFPVAWSWKTTGW